ncbi:MAG: hypothetical protein RMJ37_05510, partial [Spirochaetia bacterium]|nr:hypothetical protein [Spirochaetota bacterium]MDW8112774.1 hypothetical protein [Spirochaetia bacterium]
MKRFRIGFALKSAIIISVVIFGISLVVSYFVINSIYSLVQTYTVNMLKVINKGFKDDYYDYEVEAIRAYGEEILKRNINEYEYFMDVIEPTLIGFAEYYDIWNTKKPEEFNEFIASVFYWDGSKIYSKDPSYQDDEFLEFLSKLDLKVGESTYYLDADHSDAIYVFKLKKGVIGVRVHPEIYNRAWLRSVFIGANIDFYSAVFPKQGRYSTNFVEVIDELAESGVSIEDVY